MADPLLTPTEFAQQIKAKYPDYANVPDAELATRMLEKYPEYRNRVHGDFTTTNAVDEQGNPIVRFGKEVGAAINPITAVNAIGQAIAPPQLGGTGLATTIKHIGAAQGALYDKAKAAYDKGDYVSAAAHFMNYLLPLIGPQLDIAGEKMRSGDIAGGAGQAVGLGLAMFGPEAISKLPATRASTGPLIKSQLNPAEAAAVQFGRTQGVPIDAATATGSRFVRGAQKIADESLLGSPIGARAHEAQAQALTRVGEQQAGRSLGIAATPEQAGQNLIDALESKVTAHQAMADASYDKLRAIEADPAQSRQVRVTTKATRGVPATVQMPLPVDLRASKAALTPIYQQLLRQYSVTQREASPGLKALENVVKGPDYAPLSQVDRDLSAIKTIAREQGGVAKLAVQNLDAAVRLRASRAGPEAIRALEQGRQAIIAREGTREVLDLLRTEPVQAYRQLTAPKDSAIDLLRTVTKQTPLAAPGIARAYLDDLLNTATAEGGFARTDRLQAEWRKLGTETKKILFPQAGHAEALDHFFLLAKRIAENPNPSGTAGTAIKTAELLAPVMTLMQGNLPAAAGAIGGSVTLGGLAKLLHSPGGVRAVTRGITLSLSPSKITPAAQAAAIGAIVKAAQEAGVDRSSAAPVPPTQP